LIINFERYRLLVHLKMSGQLILIPAGAGSKFIGGHPTRDMFGDLPNKTTRIIFNLSDGSKLFFNDQRKFGWVRMESGKAEGIKLLSSMGPEPLEESFAWETLKINLLRRKNTSVKVTLLDQRLVAGVGNIYACEACFIAGIHPKKRIVSLSDQEFRNLFKAIREALKRGIKYGGSSKTHFINPAGKKGLFLDHAFVYGREGFPCKNCGSEIKKIKLGGRGTFFCPTCQVELSSAQS
jgi:formamidopyrimidine-DNA glycosylase